MSRRIRWNHYTDKMGRTISVKATQDRDGRWIEHWDIRQLMAVDLSRDEDPQEERPLVYQTASKPSNGSQPHLNTPRHSRAKKNTTREGAK